LIGIVDIKAVSLFQASFLECWSASIVWCVRNGISFKKKLMKKPITTDKPCPCPSPQ
jgi:hypothetical protein